MGVWFIDNALSMKQDFAVVNNEWCSGGVFL